MTDIAEQIAQLEKVLAAKDNPMVPYPAKYLPLKDGKNLYIHQVYRDTVPLLLDAVRPLITKPQDYYDIVAARVYAELLGYLRYRVFDAYVLVGTVNGTVVGLVTQRNYSEKVGMSLHTLTLKRGLRVGPAMFAAKMEYALDFLKQDEVLIVAESPHGFRRWMEEYSLEERFETPHELGGTPTYVLTKKLWDAKKAEKNIGLRPVPQEVIDANKEIKIPSPMEVLYGV